MRVEVERKAYDAALTLIETAPPSSPNRTGWLMRKADILVLAGRLADAQAARLAALEEIERAVAARPSAINLVTRAQILMALERYVDARRDIELALRKAPHYRAAQELQAKLPVDVGTTGAGGRDGGSR